MAKIPKRILVASISSACGIIADDYSMVTRATILAANAWTIIPNASRLGANAVALVASAPALATAAPARVTRAPAPVTSAPAVLPRTAAHVLGATKSPASFQTSIAGSSIPATSAPQVPVNQIDSPAIKS